MLGNRIKTFKVNWSCDGVAYVSATSPNEAEDLFNDDPRRYISIDDFFDNVDIDYMEEE